MTLTFETSDPEKAHDFLNRAYVDNHMLVSTVPGSTVRFQHTRHDIGLVYHDVYINSMDCSFATQPLGRLLLARLAGGQFQRDSAGTSERFTAGDVFVVGDPHRPHAAAYPSVHMDLVGIDLAAVAGLTGDPGLTEPGRLRLHGYQPVTPAARQVWHSTLDHLPQMLATGDGTAPSPLLAGSLTRLLTATALTVFPNNILTGPTTQDSRDAHPDTLRRAIAFIDGNAHRDITIADIAAACFVTTRAIQLAFRRHLDTTPTDYLRRVRLDHAHHDLLAADPARETVTAVAYRWGFTSTSRFAVYYRRAYGQLPSHTLRHD